MVLVGVDLGAFVGWLLLPLAHTDHRCGVGINTIYLAVCSSHVCSINKVVVRLCIV